MAQPHLIVLSHGSRHRLAHDAIASIAQATAPLVDAPSVQVAHLEFDEERTMTKVAEGLGEAVVVPLLFSGGYHTQEDVPEQISEAVSVTGTDLKIARTLGAGEDIARLLAASLADVPTDRTVVLYSVGSSMASAQEAVINLARSVAALTGHHIEFISATNMKRSVADVQAEYGPIHLLPLFVAPGLLLDKAHLMLADASSASPFLGAQLAAIVAERYRAATNV